MGQMARTVATLPKGSRITDFISLGVIAKTFPVSKIHAILAATGKSSVRQRDLPAHVVVYYVIALALYMHSSYREVLRCLLEGIQWLLDPSATVKVAGKSGISQARTRLGWEAVRRLHDEVVRPIAIRSTRGAWYAEWRLVSLDGSTLDVADGAGNDEAFGRPGASRGSSAYPQIRFVSLVENGTHVLFGSQMASYATGEITLAKAVLASLRPGHAVLGGSAVFRLRAMESGAGDRSRSAVADQEEHAPGAGTAIVRRILSEPHLPVRARLAAPYQWGQGARHRLSPGRR
jgi:hypothetical protein